MKEKKINVNPEMARGFSLHMEIKDLFFRSLIGKGFGADESKSLSQHLLKSFINEYGGLQFYCPVGTWIESANKARDCFEKYNSGKITVLEASKEMGVTTRHAYRVLKQMRNEKNMERRKKENP